jgi:hypothetical protein
MELPDFKVAWRPSSYPGIVTAASGPVRDNRSVSNDKQKRLLEVEGRL